ncbi:MAG: hypothetical protein Q8Q62_15850 [Mesorhizobium sp.]|nr:hypothetical protein [Mesorhizobium sp.]
MEVFTALALAFSTGLTVAGLSGAAMELIWSRRLSLQAPFVAPGHLLRSLAASAAAGSFMLANDALGAFHAGRIGWAGLSISLAISGVWVLATGIVVAEFALGLTG